jgi:hypothetical protein
MLAISGVADIINPLFEVVRSRLKPVGVDAAQPPRATRG